MIPSGMERQSFMTGPVSRLKSREENRAVWLMLGSSLAFSLMDVCSKLAVNDVGVWPLTCYRGVMLAVIMAALIRLQARRQRGADPAHTGWRGAVRAAPAGGSRWRRLLADRNAWLLVSRGVFGSLGLVCYLYAISRMKLADAVILNKTSPVFVLLFAALMLEERITGGLLLALAVGFYGVYHVVKPDLSMELTAGLVGLLSAVFSAAAYLSVKKLTAWFSPLHIVLCFALVSVVMALPPTVAGFRVPPAASWLPILGVGASAAVGQLTMTHAYRLAPAGRISIVTYANVVFAVVWGWWLFGEVQDGRSLLGSLLILASTLSLLFTGGRAARRA